MCACGKCILSHELINAPIIVMPQYTQYGINRGQGGGLQQIYCRLCPQGVGLKIFFALAHVRTCSVLVVSGSQQNIRNQPAHEVQWTEERSNSESKRAFR